jgi:hypothetical protein
MKKMDYNKEASKLNQDTIWKPETGLYRVVILNEPEHTSFRDDDKNEDIPLIKLNIEVKKSGQTEFKQLEWYVGIGKTTKSTYGQLMIVGKENNTLTGVPLTVTVTEVNKKRSYSIKEAIEIISREQKVE